MSGLPVRRPGLASPAGLALVEVMVALAIGLVLLLVIERLFMSSIGAQQAQSDVTAVNEIARAALDQVSGALRKAGYPNTAVVSQPRYFCANSNAGSVGPSFIGSNGPATIDPASADLQGFAVTLLNNSDVLRVRYFGAATSEAAMQNCLGSAINQGDLVEDTLYVARDDLSGEPALFCHTRLLNQNTGAAISETSASSPVVVGVETLQLLYAEDRAGNGNPDAFLPWRTSPNGTLADTVLTVRAAIVVRGPAQGNVSSARTFKLFGPSYPAAANNDAGAQFSATSRHLRKMFASDIGLRNFARCNG